jgi:hypothetical protein
VKLYIEIHRQSPYPAPPDCGAHGFIEQRRRRATMGVARWALLAGGEAHFRDYGCVVISYEPDDADALRIG